MNTRETLAAADLIPGDIDLVTGDEVIGYPYGHVLGTLVPMINRNGIVIRRVVDSEKPFEVLR